jgi:hypothetical protein
MDKLERVTALRPSCCPALMVMNKTHVNFFGYSGRWESGEVTQGVSSSSWCMASFLSFFFFSFIFDGTGAWTQGFVLLEPCLQFFLLWLFWRWVSGTICLGWLWTSTLLISASQGARITGMSHGAQQLHFYFDARMLFTHQVSGMPPMTCALTRWAWTRMKNVLSWAQICLVQSSP